MPIKQGMRLPSDNKCCTSQESRTYTRVKGENTNGHSIAKATPHSFTASSIPPQKQQQHKMSAKNEQVLVMRAVVG